VIIQLLALACIDNSFTKPSETTSPGDSAAPDCPPSFPNCHDSDPQDSPVDSPVDSEIPDCTVEVLPARAVTVNEECEGTTAPVVTDPWDVGVEWQWTSQAAYHMPLIGNLTDDDGNGKVDDNDVPDVVFVTTGGMLVVLDGATGTEHWTKSGYTGYAIGTLADVDADGVSDIIAVASGGSIHALSGAGASLWTSSTTTSSTHPLITVSDIDEDGLPEVLGDAFVLNGEDGSLDWKVTLDSSIPYFGAIAGDLDQDGTKEVIFQNKVYDHNGNVEWTSPVKGNYGHWPVLLNYDSDKEAEVAMVGAGTLAIYEDDGTQILSVSAGTTQPGPPCLADLDGDGEAEIAWPSSNTFNAYELDGSVMWTKSINDSSGLAGCSAYDIDGDGALEVLYADQDTFYIWDGASGTERYSNSNHASGTIFEYPTVADVDNDGNAEILIAHNGSPWNGVTVFGHNGDGWPKSGATWHVHDFAVTNINPDGSVPASPEPSWTKYNVFRARPAVDDPATPDLEITISEYCVAACETGLMRMAFQAWNQGGTDVSAGVGWALYAVDNENTLITSGTLPDIPAGVAPAGWEIELSVEDFGRGGVMVVIDDDGTGLESLSECDEDNNVYWVTDTPCN
jgi:hypothetical protein